jgi:2-keto-myo-inositol isomerase
VKRTHLDRRGFLASTGIGAAAALSLAAHSARAADRPYQDGISPWPLCLNTSTIRPTSLKDKIRIAAEAGYDAIEPWINDLEDHEKAGGDLKALGAEIKALGLSVPNVIGLWGCMPEGEEAWKASLDGTRNRMRMSAAIGSQHVAAIPAPDRPDFDLKWGVRCYKELLSIGRDEFGIIVAFEFVGFLKGIHRLGQACAIAIDVNDRDACLICDTFHLFRGDSGFNGIRHLDGDFIADFHCNDVLAEPPREEQGDSHRIYPGDGILPLEQLLRDLRAIEYTGPLSLEMFNKEHYAQDPMLVAKTGLQKMRALITSALA